MEGAGSGDVVSLLLLLFLVVRPYPPSPHRHHHHQIRGQRPPTEERKRKHVDDDCSNALFSRAICTFQLRIRAELRQRRVVRLIEFDAWLHDCRFKRFLLAVITNLFVGTLGLFTIIICVLLSAAFDAQQAEAWVESVLLSIAVQVRGATRRDAGWMGGRVRGGRWRWWWRRMRRRWKRKWTSTRTRWEWGESTSAWTTIRRVGRGRTTRGR